MTPDIDHPHFYARHRVMAVRIDMERLRATLRDQVQKPGESARGISLRAGLGPDAVRDILRGKSDTAKLETVAALVSVMGGELATFFQSDAAPAVGEDMRINHQTWPRDFPVNGTALGGDLEVDAGHASALVEQTELSLSDPIDFVRRPPALASGKAAYALYVVGTSMEPRYEPGDMIYVDPRRPPAIGDHVIVQLRDGNGHDGDERVVCALVKRLVRRSSTHYELAQYNPAITFKVPTSSVKEIHRVVPWGELFSI